MKEYVLSGLPPNKIVLISSPLWPPLKITDHSVFAGSPDSEKVTGYSPTKVAVIVQVDAVTLPEIEACPQPLTEDQS